MKQEIFYEVYYWLIGGAMLGVIANYLKELWKLKKKEADELESLHDNDSITERYE